MLTFTMPKDILGIRFDNCSGAVAGTLRSIFDLGFNIEDQTTCGLDTANNSLPGTDARLAVSLAEIGGPTATLALCTGAGTPQGACAGASP